MKRSKPSSGGDSASRGGDGASRSGDGASRGGDGRPRGRFGEGGPFSRQEPPIGQEFEEVKAFIRSNMPSLEAAIADLRGTGNREAIRFLYGTGLFQYRRFTRGNREFPDMEATYLQDVRDTDELIGLAREYRISEAPRRDEIRGEMQKKLESVARSIMAERDRRIEKLRAALDREQKALERDQTQLEQNVGTRLGEFLSRIGAERNSQSVEPGEPPDSPGGRSALIPNLEKNRPPTTKPHKDR